MPPRRVWQHVVINTRCSWLHGDQRGFRSREHRINSNGDYKNPPPEEEHAQLYKYHSERSSEPVSFDFVVRIMILEAFVKKIVSLGYRIIACSVGDDHLHALVELVNEYDRMKKEVGKCKQKASHAVRKLLPGNIWSEGGEFNRIRDPQHLENTYGYIRTKQEAGTVVWSHSEDENWITNPLVGIVVMVEKQQSIRLFGVPQRPASGGE